MKFFKSFNPRFWLLLAATATLFTLTGCATSDSEMENRSERPWNAPKSWENSLPGGMMEGR